MASEPDEASVNQRSELLELAPWSAGPPFSGRPSYRHGDWRLVSIPELHLYRDHLDRDLAAAFGEPFDLIVYLSKHQSGSGRPSLTVHPVGNPRAADLGGRPGSLVPAAPRRMTGALRTLRREAAGLDYDATFEATHHGPYLETPSFFIEQGSTEREWGDREASRAIARTLLAFEPVDAPVALGVGGGHYVPRHSDLAKTRRIAFGHLLATYVLEGPLDALLDQAVDRTPGATLAYVHRKAVGKAEARELEDALGARGLRVVREADLEPDEAAKTS